MSPEVVAVSGPATKKFALPPNGLMVARTWPVARSSCVTAPLPAGIHSESPETTAWNTGSQSAMDALPGKVPRFGGGFQSVGTVQVETSFPPCQTRCCSFQTCRFQASGPHGKGLREPAGAQET